jgi:hypothetical protein
MENKTYHTIRTILKSNEKQNIPHHQNNSKIWWKTKHTTPSVFGRGLETGGKARIWRAIPFCFSASANKVYI